MDRSRKENREGREHTFQYKSRPQALLDEELTEDKLAQLLSFIEELKQTTTGSADLERRSKAFGDVERTDGESTMGYFAKLHRWLHRDFPRTKSPLHPPRQN